MASKTGNRPSLELQQNAIGSQGTVEANDCRSLPAEVLKKSKSKLVDCGQSEESGKLTATGPVLLDAIETKRSLTNSTECTNSPSGNSDSNISSTYNEQVSTDVDPEVYEITSSLETSVYLEKKTAEQGSVKNSSVSAKDSDGGCSPVKMSRSAKVSDRADYIESGQNSTCRGSKSSDVSDESTCSSLSSIINKPHKANDLNWEAIQAVRTRDGVLGLSHFRLLKRLGCGDIGSVFLAELSGMKCHFAMKVMDKSSLASRKKLIRAQTEREILQSLDHPFLPTLYTHFETDNFSCLVMEFCPGGDLHALRQRQPGKYFTEQAVKYDSLSSPFYSYGS